MSMFSESALLAVDRHQFINTIEGGFEYTMEMALAKDNHYTLFRQEDWAAWVTFSTVFAVLLIFDNVVLNRRHQALTVLRAMVYTVFWILCACAFCGYIYYSKGQSASFSWMSGYLLEWMLSFDNLFVFHLIFTVYGTPDNMKHKPLYWGICGAIFFRLLFIFIGEYLMHAVFFMHIVFGSFLVYTGIQTVMADEEDEDPSQHPFVQWLSKKVPFVGAYDKDARFFVRVPVDEHGEPLQDGWSVAASNEEEPLLVDAEETISERRYPTVDFAAVVAGAQATNSEQKIQLRATMLFLVVVCLEVSDILFAVDSVSAIVAQVNDLFLAYTSAVFAMLGLRATFFVIDVLVQLFSLLKYGVAAVLVFVGVKLCLSRVYHIPPSIVVLVLVTALGSSMVASVLQDAFQKKAEGQIPPEILERVEKIKAEASKSPSIARQCPSVKIV